MTEEIKEILDELKNDDYIRPYEDVYSEYPIKTIDKKQTKILLNYITNLQQYYNDNVNKYEELLVKYSDLQKEKEELKIKISAREEVCEDYKQRCEEAIEYIEEKGRLKYAPQELINILQGGDE